jgi:hypothetical protein
MTERYFFEIAVYSRKEDSFYAEFGKIKKKHLDELYIKSGRISRDQAPDTYAWAEESLFKEYGCWRYNQAIGWIRLYVLGTQIRGTYYFVEAKQIRLLMKNKKFVWRGKAFELSFYPEDSSIKIYNEVRAELESLHNEKFLKGRHIDLEAFYGVGEFINWRKLMGFDEAQHNNGMHPTPLALPLMLLE